jgi:hypothetical protein
MVRKMGLGKACSADKRVVTWALTELDVFENM